MRLDPSSSLVCVIDLQERLLAAVPDGSVAVHRTARLARAAALLGIPMVLTEQYPKGLGPTPPALANLLPPAVAKMEFSAAATIEQVAGNTAALESIVLCGLETHVCIAHTALDLLARGYVVFIVVDAVAARHSLDHQVALRRLEGAGAILVTSEAVLFEWCRSAEHPQFQAVRQLVLEADRAGTGPAGHPA